MLTDFINIGLIFLAIS